MTRQEEQYIHFVSCIDNLNEAWRILQIIKQSKGNLLVGPAFQFALIEYSKPYINSRGIAKTNHRLSNKFVPVEHRDLHNEILAARKTIHAHSDLTVDDARIHVANTVHGKHVALGKNIVYDTEKISRIDDIVDLIEQSLDSMYKEVKQLEAALPLSS
jgi:hypothetical protein